MRRGQKQPYCSMGQTETTWGVALGPPEAAVMRLTTHPLAVSACILAVMSHMKRSISAGTSPGLILKRQTSVRSGCKTSVSQVATARDRRYVSIDHAGYSNLRALRAAHCVLGHSMRSGAGTLHCVDSDNQKGRILRLSTQSVGSSSTWVGNCRTITHPRIFIFLRSRCCSPSPFLSASTLKTCSHC